MTFMLHEEETWALLEKPKMESLAEVESRPLRELQKEYGLRSSREWGGEVSEACWREGMLLESQKWAGYEKNLTSLESKVVGKLTKSVVFCGRCAAQEEVSKIKEPFDLAKKPTTRFSSPSLGRIEGKFKMKISILNWTIIMRSMMRKERDRAKTSMDEIRVEREFDGKRPLEQRIEDGGSYSASCVTPFVRWIEDSSLLDGLKMSSHVGSYDGKGDPDNYLHLFKVPFILEGKVPVTLQPTEKVHEDAFGAKEVATNIALSDHKEGFDRFNKGFSWDNNKGKKKNRDKFSLYKGSNHGLLTNLSKSLREILATKKVAKLSNSLLAWSKADNHVTCPSTVISTI
nr:reverse transcriptase domain-containing protein [Tanacetum cinerariifolium]